MYIFSSNDSGASSLQVARDSTSPTISGLVDVVAEATGKLTVVQLIVPTITDHEGPTPSVTNDAPADGYQLGSSIITWTARDDAGNMATALQKVTLVDTSPPAITAPADVVVYVDSSIIASSVSLGTVAVKDSVDGSPYVTNDAPYDGFPVGVTTVTWKAVDSSGNTSTDAQLVLVLVIEENPSTSTTNSGKNIGSSGTSASYSSGGSGGGSTSDGRGGSAQSSNQVSTTSTMTSFTADGSNYYDIPHRTSLSLEKFSLSAWFKTSANYYENAMIANKGGSGSELSGRNMNYGIWMTSAERLKAGFESSNGTNYFVTHSNTYSDGNWHYAVVTYDGSALRLYVDGEQLAWRPITAIPDKGSTEPLRISANSQAEDSYFTGQIDEVRVRDGALTATEVADQYSSGIFRIREYSIPTIGGVKPTSLTYGSTIHTVCDSGCTHKTIRSAIDSLPSGGGKVILKASRTFTPSSTISLRSNTVIEFEQGATLTYSGTDAIFSGDKINNVMFINPVISRSNAGDVIYFSDSDNIIVQGGKINGVKGLSSSGFKCDSCKDVLVQGGTYSVFSRPIDIGTLSGNTDGTTRNVWLVENVVSDSSIECVHLNNGHDMHAISNTVRDCSNNGIDVGYDVRVEAKYNKLSNTGYNTVDNAVGFHTDSSNTVLLLENSIDITGTDAITVCGSDNNYVIGNWISNTGKTVKLDQGNGIEVIRCGASSEQVPEKTIIDGNHISKTLDAGIYVTQHATEVYITNNTIENYGTDAIFDNSKEATKIDNIIH
jgi:hypothetical protein